MLSNCYYNVSRSHSAPIPLPFLFHSAPIKIGENYKENSKYICLD